MPATPEFGPQVLEDSTGAEVLGKVTDPKSTATDDTPVGAIALLKQISASVQAGGGSGGSGGGAVTAIDGGLVTIGAKADAKSTATDATPVSAVSIWKQISASVQAMAAGFTGAVTSVDGGLVTIGVKADAKSAATDTTPVSAVSIWKQISASMQVLANIITAGKLPVTIDAAQLSSPATTDQPKSAGFLLVGLATDQAPVRIKSGGDGYKAIAASQSGTLLGSTGAIGDYLEGLLCVVAIAATSQVQISDGSGSAMTVLPNNVGAGVGTYYVPLGISATGAGWHVTTAAGVSVFAFGKYT